jgi:hypothetical protein
VAHTGAKTVRFTKIVERSGEPHVHTLWLPPEKDRELKRAVGTHRVMTIEPGASGNTDVGFVGFDPKRKTPAQFLIFPKSLKRFEGARVVGIKFDLVEQPKFAAASELKAALRAGRPKRAKGKRPAQPVPAVAEAKEEHADEPEQADDAEKKVVAFEAESKSAPPAAAAKHKHEAAPPAHAALIREVRAALKELKAGKAVVAYQRLERAVEK